MYWSPVAQYWNQWRAFMNTLWTFDSIKGKNVLNSGMISQEWLWPAELNK
jgi:hypothetical protein